MNVNVIDTIENNLSTWFPNDLLERNLGWSWYIVKVK